MPEENELIKEREEKLSQLKRRGEESEVKRMASAKGLSYLDLTTLPIDRDNINLIPKADAQRASIIVIRREKKDLRVGVVDPNNKEALQIIDRLKSQGFDLDVNVISQSSFAKAIKEYEKIPAPTVAKKVSGVISLATLSVEEKGLKTFSDVKNAIEGTAKGEISKLLELILAASLSLEVSDVHIEPEENNVRIRLRVDGILQDAGLISRESYRLLLSRVKLAAGIPLNIRDVSQDGRFTIDTGKFEAESRVSVFPGGYGEYIVMRILNPMGLKLKIEDLGLRGDLWEKIKVEIEKPNGVSLVTGPSGSGKTTTLYAFMKYLLKPALKILTLEDPIEYHIEGISQSQIEADKGYTFSEALKAALRQDPDIVLVGEIRDEKTASVVLNAALTGHLIFSTLHSNDSIGAIPRFLDLNAKPKILGSVLNLIIAQRLVRVLCKECKKKEKPTVEELSKIQSAIKKSRIISAVAKNKEMVVWRAPGCDECLGTGYRGRTGVFEILVIDKEMEELIGTSPQKKVIQDLADKKDFTSMYQDGILKVLDGITTIEEVERVAEALE